MVRADIGGHREKTHEGIKEVVKPFDWSYSTEYKGTLRANSPPFEETTKTIPIELLKRPDPILFFDEVVLYEDELADNGITMLSCKIRVMPGRLLLLCRFFMRLDNVLIRLRDTRVYVDFERCEVIREYQAKEGEYEKVRQVRWTGGAIGNNADYSQTIAATRNDMPAFMRDPNRLSEVLPIVEKRCERVVVGE